MSHNDPCVEGFVSTMAVLGDSRNVRRYVGLRVCGRGDRRPPPLAHSPPPSEQFGLPYTSHGNLQPHHGPEAADPNSQCLELPELPLGELVSQVFVMTLGSSLTHKQGTCPVPVFI